jgi:hypothetical protein
MSKDYRNTAYCLAFDSLDQKKVCLNSMLLNKHPNLKDMHNKLKDNKEQYKKEFMKIYNHKCVYCGNSIDNLSLTSFEIDHYICKKAFKNKVEAGKMENLVLSCYDCNRSKGEFLIIDKYRQLLNPDLLSLQTVFVRNNLFYIEISDAYKNDVFIKSFYEKLKLSYQARRLDFLLLNLNGLYKKHAGTTIGDKLCNILIKIKAKRNLTSLHSEDC